MKLYEIPEKTSLEILFKYQGKEYLMNVDVKLKMDDMIFIQAINSNGTPVDTSKIDDAVITYKTEAGIYNFNHLKIKLATYQGTYLYGISSDYEAEKYNRRDTYRVFIGEVYEFKLIKRDGSICEMEGMIKDISLNGIGIIISRKIEDIAFIKVEINLSKNCSFIVLGEIVRIFELPNHKGYLYGCKINSQSELLNRYVMSRQLKKRIDQQALQLAHFVDK